MDGKCDNNCNYVELLLPYGYKYERGFLELYEINIVVDLRLYNTLRYANYTWNYGEPHEVWLLYDHFSNLAREDHKDDEFIESLFIHILSRDERYNGNMLHHVAAAGSANLVKRAYKLGFTHDERTIVCAANYSVLEALHDSGCPWHPELLERVLKSMILTRHGHEHRASFYGMIKYAIKNGCEINAAAAKYAADNNIIAVTQLMCEMGYVFTDDILVNSSCEHDVKKWMREYATK